MVRYNITVLLLALSLFTACGGGGGGGGTSNTTTGTGDTGGTGSTSVPGSPTGLRITGVTAGSITLAWSDVSGEDNYVLQRSTGSASAYTTVTSTISANSTSYTDNTVAAATTYYYRIYASNSVGDSGLSNEVSTTTLAGIQPLLFVTTSEDTSSYYNNLGITIDSSRTYVIRVTGLDLTRNVVASYSSASYAQSFIDVWSDEGNLVVLDHTGYSLGDDTYVNVFNAGSLSKKYMPFVNGVLNEKCLGYAGNVYYYGTDFKQDIFFGNNEGAEFGKFTSAATVLLDGKLGDLPCLNTLPEYSGNMAGDGNRLYDIVKTDTPVNGWDYFYIYERNTTTGVVITPPTGTLYQDNPALYTSYRYFVENDYVYLTRKNISNNHFEITQYGPMSVPESSRSIVTVFDAFIDAGNIYDVWLDKNWVAISYFPPAGVSNHTIHLINLDTASVESSINIGHSISQWTMTVGLP